MPDVGALFDEKQFQRALKLGHVNSVKANHTLRTALTRWTEALARTDAGFFKTTPFFISYIDSAQSARTAHFRYLTGLAKAALGDRASALEDLRLSVQCDPSRLYPWLEFGELAR